MTDHDEYERPDRAECLICRGSGSVAVILGDDEMPDRCWSCNGTGLQLSRDELCRSLAETGDDLRLVPEAEWDATGYSNHGEEVAAAMRELDRTRRAS